MSLLDTDADFKDELLDKLSKVMTNFDDYKRMRDFVEQEGISDDDLKNLIDTVNLCRSHSKNALVDIQRKLEKGNPALMELEERIKQRDFVASVDGNAAFLNAIDACIDVCGLPKELEDRKESMLERIPESYREFVGGLLERTADKDIKEARMKSIHYMVKAALLSELVDEMAETGDAHIVVAFAERIKKGNKHIELLDFLAPEERKAYLVTIAQEIEKEIIGRISEHFPDEEDGGMLLASYCDPDEIDLNLAFKSSDLRRLREATVAREVENAKLLAKAGKPFDEILQEIRNGALEVDEKLRMTAEVRKAQLESIQRKPYTVMVVEDHWPKGKPFDASEWATGLVEKVFADEDKAKGVLTPVGELTVRATAQAIAMHTMPDGESPMMWPEYRYQPAGGLGGSWDKPEESDWPPIRWEGYEAIMRRSLQAVLDENDIRASISEKGFQAMIRPFLAQCMMLSRAALLSKPTSLSLP